MAPRHRPFLLLSLFSLLVISALLVPAGGVSKSDGQRALRWIRRSPFLRNLRWRARKAWKHQSDAFKGSAAAWGSQQQQDLWLRALQRQGAKNISAHGGVSTSSTTWKDILSDVVLIALQQSGPITLFMPMDTYQISTVLSQLSVSAVKTFAEDHMVPSIIPYADLKAADSGTEYTTVASTTFKKLNSNLTSVVSLIGGTYFPTFVVVADAFSSSTLVIHVILFAILP